jgi:ADP-heptose:LPS heptosyltransferase
MGQEPEGAAHPQSVMIFRALQLGDMLCAVPALRALRRAWPDAHVALVGLPWASEFADRYDQYIDEFIAFPGHPDLPELTATRVEVEAFAAMMRGRAFDLAVQMHGAGSITNPIVASFGARRIGGFHPPEERAPGPLFIPCPEREPERVRLLMLAEQLGAPQTSDALEFPLRAADQAGASALRDAFRITRPYVCVHPGARAEGRRWPPARFAAVADALAAQGFAIAITGSETERGIACQVAGAMRHPASNIAGRTDLGTLAALLASSSLVICNDTGVSHLADALRVPSVVVFSGSDPGRWAPADRSLHRVVAAGCTDREVLCQANVLLRTEAVHA